MTTGEKSKMDEHEIIKLRKDKIKKLREEKIHPFTNTKQPDTTAADIIEKFSDFPKDKLEETGKEECFSIAGRLMSLRVMGKLAFAHLQDETASIQVMFTKNFMKDNFAVFKETVDVGDIIWVEGEIFMTRKGELSILVHEHLLLTKNSRPLPEKFHGLTDKETRYRQRYVDLLMNEDVRKVFKKRTEIIKYIRNFMDNRGFMEVETPMMHPLVSGAAARPFVTHHNTLDMSLYMRIAPECYLKRLLVGGLGKVYEINRNFRNEGMDSMHNPEFTMMEFYWPYVTFKEQMDFTEEMFSTMVEKLFSSRTVTYQGEKIDFSRPWKRITIRESLIENDICSSEELESRETLVNIALSKGLEKEKISSMSRLKIMMELFEEFVEGTFTQPTFVTEYPAEVSPLARKNDENPEYVDRFELFVAGHEISNGFSEQNDPEDQYKAFEAQLEAKKAGDEEAVDMDEDYIRALEYGMPPAAGQGIGIDRLVMLLTDSPSIRDVILFPLMRSEN